MTIVISAISRCTGTGHVHVTGTVNGVARSFDFQRSDLDLDPDDVFAAAISRLRSAVKEAGATTPTQISNALVGKTFQV